MGKTNKISYSELLEILNENENIDLKNAFMLCKNIEERKTYLYDSLNLNRPITTDAIKRVYSIIKTSNTNKPFNYTVDEEEIKNSDNETKKDLTSHIDKQVSKLPVNENTKFSANECSDFAVTKINNSENDCLENKSETIECTEVSSSHNIFTTTEDIAKEIIELKKELKSTNEKFNEILTQKNDIQESYTKLYNDFQKINSKQDNTNNFNNISMDIKKLSTLIDMNSEKITIEIPKGFIDTVAKYVDTNHLSSFEHLLSKNKNIGSHITEIIFLIFIYQNSLLD